MFRVIHRTVLALVGFSLPFEWLNVNVAGYPITPSKVMTGLLVVVVAIQWAQGSGRAPRDRKLLWIALLAVSVVIATVKALLDGFPLVVLQLCVTWFLLFIFYGMLVYTLRTREDVEILLAAVALGGIGVVIPSAMGTGVQAYSAQGARLAGQAGNPNYLGFNLVLILPVAFALLYSVRSRFMQLCYLGVIAITLGALVATLSRSAFLAVGLMAVLWMFRFRRFDLLRYTVPMLGVLAIALYFAPPSFFQRIATITPNTHDMSARDRLLQLPLVWEAFISHPFIGIGLGTFPEFTFQHSTNFHNVVHNAFLHVLAEQGILGFVPFVAIFVLTWLELSRCWRVSRQRRFRSDSQLTHLGRYAVLLQIGFAGMIVISLFQPSSRYKALWLAMAISTVLYGLTRRRVAELVHEETGAPLHRFARRAPALEVPARAPTLSG